MARPKSNNSMTQEQEIITNYQYNPIDGFFYYRLWPGRRADVICNNGYSWLTVHSKRMPAHRAAYVFMTGKLPIKELQVDHVNGIRSDNRWDNLRLATPSQNMHNQGIPSHNKSGYKGVSFDATKSRWLARLQLKGNKIHLGYYDSPELAHAAVTKAREQYHQEFANHGDVNG